MKIRNIKQVKDHVRDMSMKRLFRRNQIIITTLAVMIAAAGYLNYAGKRDLAAGSGVYEAGAMDISDADILAENQAAALTGEGELEEIPSLDQDFTELAAGIVSQIVLVDDGSETGNRKLRKALEAVKVLEKRKGVPILTKCMLLYNRFSSSHGRKLEKLPVSEAGGIPRYEGASPRALAEKLSVLPVFEKL